MANGTLCYLDVFWFKKESIGGTFGYVASTNHWQFSQVAITAVMAQTIKI